VIRRCTEGQRYHGMQSALDKNLKSHEAMMVNDIVQDDLMQTPVLSDIVKRRKQQTDCKHVASVKRAMIVSLQHNALTWREHRRSFRGYANTISGLAVLRNTRWHDQPVDPVLASPLGDSFLPMTIIMTSFWSKMEDSSGQDARGRSNGHM
jgi:hypothetical protein